MHLPLLTYAQAAQFLGVKVGTLYAWVHHRHVPHIRLTSRLVRFDPDDLIAWRDAHRVPAVRLLPMDRA